jgi:SP family myo-inositol transporter-like MFS transporter 13
MSHGSKASSLVWKVTSFLLHAYELALTVLAVRGIGTSLSTATNWAGNLLIGSTYLSLMAKITPAGAFGFYAGLCLLGWLFCVFFLPETAGLSLEEVQNVFRDGFGIRDSQRMRDQKREMRMHQTIKAKQVEA